MSEDLTQNLPNSFAERVLAELAAIRQENAQTNAHLVSLDSRLTPLEGRVLSIDTRLNSLEEKVDARLRETRPIWESVLHRLTEIDTGLHTLNRQFKTMIRAEFELRTRVEKLEDSQPMP